MKTGDVMSASNPRAARTAAALAAGVCLALLTGCGHMPWHHKVAKPAQPVTELVEVGADGAATSAYPQYWKRNTLIVDLSAAASSGGQVTLKTQDGHKWPVRIAFRVMPGTIGLLEVQADQRLLMPVTREGAQPVDLELVPGVYTPKTQQITVKWEAAKS